jgi:hypothetical protein
VAALTMYIDDSGTSPTNHIAVAAGWVARTPGWVLFEREWKKARSIVSDKFESMHTSEFVDGRGSKNEFKDWSLEKKQRVAARLRQIIKKRALKGFALGVIKRDYDEIVPDVLKAKGFENHYTYAIRRVLGMIDDWRKQENITAPIEYIFDWSDKDSPVRREIETIFSSAENEPEALRRYGLHPGGFGFRKREVVTPLQAADMFGWTMYQAVLNEVEKRKMNPIAVDMFKEFYLHRHGNFIEGGYNTREQIIKWVKSKGLNEKQT